jgi:NADPH:quinone reductase-like Zn-dependent oxidoreductase
LGEDLDGGYAEYVAVKARIVVPVPERISLQEAAVVTCTVGTAYHACKTRGHIAAGETILVTGASGGVGLHAVKVAKMLGSRVIGVTSSQTRASAVLRAGADDVIITADRRFAKNAKVLNGGVGVDAVIEVVGGPTLMESIHSLVPGGRLVLVGNVLGEEVKIRPAHFILKELTMIGIKSCSKLEMLEVLQLVADGALSIDVAEVMPLVMAETAHRRMEEGTVEGRVVLEVSKDFRSLPVKDRG